MPGTQTETSAGPARGIAARLWSAARTEFAARGYHGARVQGIARRATCNVALLYRHWASKRALYLEILRSIWVGNAQTMAKLTEDRGGAVAVVSAYLEVRLADPEASQILIREYLDGGPFLRELLEKEPTLAGPMLQAAAALRGSNGHALRPGVDPLMAVMTIGGLASLAASAKDATTPFFESQAPTDEDWKRHLSDLLLNGLLAR
jgi:TetR/AcrR family transcriptional regulator